MAITVKATKPVGEPELLRAEASLAVSIHEGYRAFLQATDGGRPNEGTFSPNIGVTEFLGAREIVSVRSRLRGRLPETLLPIAGAEGGNYICISVAEGQEGAIYFWDHQFEGDRATERLAVSFDDFVSQLREQPLKDLSPHRVLSVEIDPEFLKMVREQEQQAEKRATLHWPRGDP
jgi:SMI1-KNR4 cell-wall